MRAKPRSLSRPASPCRDDTYDWRDHVPRNSDARLGGVVLLAMGLIFLVTAIP